MDGGGGRREYRQCPGAGVFSQSGRGTEVGGFSQQMGRAGGWLGNGNEPSHESVDE